MVYLKSVENVITLGSDALGTLSVAVFTEFEKSSVILKICK